MIATKFIHCTNQKQNATLKGKEHKKYEFGSKASFLVTQSTEVIVGAMDFTETLHDSKTLSKALEQHQRLMEKAAAHVFLDRGIQGGNTDQQY